VISRGPLGRALVLGAAGQLGHELVLLLGPETGIDHERLSITDAAAVEAIIEDRRPDVVFNCAAYNAVDGAEVDSPTAFSVNGNGPANVAAACRRNGAALVHFSTNFVFDGATAEPYVESDEPAPLSVYGRSKLAGEQAVLEAGGHVLVIRTAAVFGTTTGRSFPERIVDRARAGEKLRVVSDQAVNPTYARDLAVAAVELADQGFAGIVHAVADGCCGWDEFARVALAWSGLDASVVEPVRSVDLQAAARRPVNGCLATIRYRALRPWQEAVRDWARTRKTP
jgi:dTDP-4-dehydrorhamnose reductase